MKDRWRRQIPEEEQEREDERRMEELERRLARVQAGQRAILAGAQPPAPRRGER